MMDLREDLLTVLRGRVAVVGIGNPDLGDDGVGVRLAEALAARGVPHVCAGERTPEHWLGRLRQERYDAVLLLDAVDAGRPPGDVVLLEAAMIQARFPQVSTHRLSLGLLARLLHAEGAARVLLLGIQPGSLALGKELSPSVRKTAQVLTDLLGEFLIPTAGARSSVPRPPIPDPCPLVPGGARP